MAGLRYNENRVYQSRCQNMACRETVTVTAPSWVAAEQLFSRFEQASVQPNTTIVNHDIVFNPTGNEFDEARDQLLGTYKLVKIEDWEYKFIKQPKLSIPKKIAEELDTILKEYPGWIYEGFHRLASRSLMMWCENNSGFNNCVAYLAGKALGVELVEVEE
ncbi:hypothetical protein [Lactococcus garvieae]|uniref:hypothetical protein n=1 Tax=Lactococcus garvieae TaxID=1363 RepID=UPI00398F757D